jgi:hypothetical protein
MKAIVQLNYHCAPEMMLIKIKIKKGLIKNFNLFSTLLAT